ncbi:DUF4230 domain-containing protein [Flavobacteriaceae bacterium 3-367]|uniref:DUF4230 domain-containing protein n=1 Tax=Eudoraea algarum TaxID=3417568 RepID=UPI00327708B3
MRKVLVGMVVALAGVLIFRSCANDKRDKEILVENTMLIQQEITKVSKLIVTEGHFAEVYNYRDSQELFGSMIRANKKALVVVNAEVTVAYDLGKIGFHVDEAHKTLNILEIPEPEVKINPDFEYYDLTSDYFNQFSAEDHNKIKDNINASLSRKIEASSLKTNAENRLLSELAKFYVLTSSMGWTLTYKENPISDLDDLKLTNRKLIDQGHTIID